MANFVEYTAGVEHMTAAMLDDIALNKGGVVASIGQGYALRGAVPPRHGYGFQWVATHGEGNRGKLVMKGFNAHSAEMLHQGKVIQVRSQTDLSFTEADALIAAANGIRYGNELEVLKYATLTRYAGEAWEVYPGVGHGVWDWHSRWDLPETVLSAPRLSAVRQILANW
jgi:hypothetical protein